MGIDARIHFKGVPPQMPEHIERIGRIIPILDHHADDSPGATHEIDMAPDITGRVMSEGRGLRLPLH